MFVLSARRSTLCITWFLYWLAAYPPFVLNVILPSFSWDPRNECFSDSTNGASMKVDQESQLYILCPSVAITDKVQTLITDQKNMYENMFMCTKDEFDRCEVDPDRADGKTRLVMRCDKPLDPQKLTYQSFSFQQFQSGEHGYAFEVGEIYYFIATSNGTKEGLTNRKNGRCKANKMKLAIRICAQGENCHLENKGCTKDGPNQSKSDLITSNLRSATLSTKRTTFVESPTPTKTTPCKPVVEQKPNPVVIGAQRSEAAQGRDSSSSMTVIFVAVGAFVGGVIICLLAITIYKKACRDDGGTFPSAYCCFNRQKLRIDKVNAVNQLLT